MSTGRVVAAVVAALVAWFVVAFVGFLIAVASATGDASGGGLIVPVATVVAAGAAALVTIVVLQRGEVDAQPGPGAMLGLALIWPVVFGVGGILDGRPEGEPVWLAPVVLVAGVGLAGVAARMTIHRGSPTA